MPLGSCALVLLLAGTPPVSIGGDALRAPDPDPRPYAPAGGAVMTVAPDDLQAGAMEDLTFTFGIKGEVGLPFTIDVHERVTVVTGGFLPIGGYINTDLGNFGEVPILIRMGVEIDAADNVAPWFFFDLGPTVGFGSGGSSVDFAWRIGAGTAFWGVLGKNKNTSDSSATASAEPIE